MPVTVGLVYVCMNKSWGLRFTAGISTAYLTSSKVIQRGSKGRTIPLFLFGSASLTLPTLDDNDLEDTLLLTTFPFSAYYPLKP